MNKKYIYYIGFIILIGSISIIFFINKESEASVSMFQPELNKNDWAQIMEQISDLIDEDSNHILLQEMTLSWNKESLKQANIRVQSEKTNESFIISFDHDGNGKTLISSLGKLEPKDKKVKAQEIIQLLNNHTLVAYQEEGAENEYFLRFDITYGNQEFTNDKQMEGKLFKVTPEYVKPFEKNETVVISRVAVSFLANSNVYIIKHL
ncbi:hypothetical protein [Oceanobacillus salinisoli]|uniref:hypothetical protein n=1 Tax=Oceanobacillus salinisoli TaxID=2678611 RepID=UPI0012E22508|nr:hypothetical protein [Oceanobacillus salinisoli]